MSRIVKLAAAAIAIALTAAVVGIVAGHAAPRERSIRSDLSLKAPAPVVAGSVRGLPVQPQLPRYRLRLAPNVVELRPGPNCPYLTWRTIKTGGDAR